MEEEDKEFFILVLGVLAAIILVISWWFTTGGTTAPVVQTSAPAPVATAVPAPAEEAAPAPTAEPTPAPTPEPAPVALPSTVFDAVAADSNLSVVRDLLRDNSLDQALAVTGPFTVFAPSNDAVNTAAGSDTTVEILENDSSGVLSYHVVPGRYSIDELAEIAGSDDTDLVTVQGESIALSLDDDTVLINGFAAVAPESAEADNGLVYTLDNVLVPPVAALNTLVGLDPILFATGSAEIQAESFATLDQFIEVLEASNVDVSIEGHTDSSGDPLLNQNLSQSRARSVVNYLVANGIDESRLDAVGFGPDRPVADNETEEGRALNRRIEFTLNE